MLTASEIARQEPFWMVLATNSNHSRVRHYTFEAAQALKYLDRIEAALKKAEE